MYIINVASKSSTTELAQLILNSKEEIELKAIGAAAVNQAIKGLAVAEQQSNFSYICTPSFFNVIIEGEEKSGIRLRIKKEEN